MFINGQTLFILIACVLILWWTTDYTPCNREHVEDDPLPHDPLKQSQFNVRKETSKQKEEKPTTNQPKTVTEGGDSEDMKREKIKEIATQFSSQVQSNPLWSSCPGWSVWSHRHSPTDYSFAAVGSLFLPSSHNNSWYLLSSIVRQVTKEFLPETPPLFAQLGANFGGNELDKRMAALLANLIRSFGVTVLSLANKAIEPKVGVMDIFVHALEGNQLEWVGLRVKSSNLLTLGGMKVGVIAFCTYYAKCKGESTQPLSPAKYTQKAATSTVKELRKMGAEAIVVLMYWGKSHALTPTEHTLSVARHFAHLNVSLVLGDFPSLPQNHAYFKKTLVVFSLGQLLSPQSDLCWQMRAGKLEFREDVPECNATPPPLRVLVQKNERQTRIYGFTIRKGGHVTAKYKTLQLSLAGEQGEGGVLQALPSKGAETWTPVCSSEDPHCLSCALF